MEQNQYRMYVDGNTVRKAEALPKDDRQERLRREREAQRARNRKIAKRNQARELRMSRRYVAFLAVAVSITCLVCAAYVHLQADITTRMNPISPTTNGTRCMPNCASWRKRPASAWRTRRPGASAAR